MNKSPTFFNLLEMVIIVKSCGFNPFCTSAHWQGVDTGAPSLGRTQ